MKKSQFCDCMITLREYATWEQKLYKLGIDLMETPASNLVYCVEHLMRGCDDNWSYDTKLDMDWIIEWAYTPDSPLFVQTRHGRIWKLEDAGTLFDFLEFMNERGWED